MAVINLFSLESKIAIIAGGGSGLGRNIAIAFAQAGANAIVDVNIEYIHKTSNEIKKLGRQSFFIKKRCFV
jgi:NAD(P)-dependent dehydrogenase (short-subunit alcohol dehydrogenase family)